MPSFVFVHNEFPQDENGQGSRSWCFKKHGKLETYFMRCGKYKNCDGGDGGWHYRWRKGKLEFNDYQQDASTKEVKKGLEQLQCALCR